MFNSKHWVSHIPEREHPQSQTTATATTQEVEESEQSHQSLHQAPSPPTAFEKFFLPIEDPIGFAQIATSLQIPTSTPTSSRSRLYFSPKLQSLSNNSNRNNSIDLNRSYTSEQSVHTSDFVSAAEELDSDLDLDLEQDFPVPSFEQPLNSDDLSIQHDLYRNDILGLSPSKTPPILIKEELDIYTNIDLDTNTNTDHMTSKRSKYSKKHSKQKQKSSTTPEQTMSKSKQPTITTSPTAAPIPTLNPDEGHFDVVDHVYEGSKHAWAFTKEHIFLFKPFMNLTESLATKVLSTTTGGAISSLDVADENIVKHVKGIDKDLVDPAILKIWSFLEPLVGKSEELVKGVMGFMHKTPMIDSEHEHSTEGTAVEGDACEEMMGKIAKPVLNEKESCEVSAPEISTPAIVA